MQHRSAAFAIVVALLLVPTAGFSNAFAVGSTQTVTQTSPTHSTNSTNGTVTIPIPLASEISKAISLGSVSHSTRVSLGIVLPSKDQTGLEQYISEISAPISKNYRNFLTSQQYAELYGASTSEANSLSSFLSSKGLSASLDKSNPNLMIVSGTANSAEKALQVSIQSFRLGSTTFYSATSGLKLPSKFSNIQTVFGLTNYGSSINVSSSPMIRVLGAINSSQTTNANSVYYSPSELSQIYNSTSLLNAGYTGSGVTIAIVDAFGDPYIQQELNNFSAEFNLPQATVNQICVDAPCNFVSGIAEGWNTEISLDVEWAHAMAPKAAINLYIGSNNTFPLYDAVQKAVTDGVNSIISMSWGSPENSFGQSGAVAPVFGENYPWLDQVLQQAAAQGITAFASTGDWGAYDQSQGETSPYGGAIYPSTDPYVTGVGGTAVYMNTTSGFTQFPYSNATGGYGTETAWSWNNFQNGATGGGYSTLFGTPQWQSGQGLSGGSRGVPDVSWDADPQTGVIVSVSNGPGAGFTYYVVGGTSVGSPSWAGSLALIDQKAGGRLGLINPALYSIFNNPAEYSKAFHDITIGNNNPDSAGVGWDPLTGIGSPNLGELANYLVPTGSLDVSVQNGLSGSLTQSYAYGSSIGLTATVTSGSSAVTSGNVVASIVGPDGKQIGNVPFSYNSATKTWSGSYTVKSTDPAGMWTAQVSANSGASTGEGFTTFSVGDGVTLFLPYFNATTGSGSLVFLLPGEKINVSAAVTFPGGQCCVSGGNFNATFNLNTPTGKIEGQVPLAYNSTSRLWQGSFPIPYSADQGAWVLTVSGKDTNGNSGSAYSWLNVGLNVLLITDSPSYIIGDAVTIFAAPEYPNGLVTASGNFTAAVAFGSKLVSEVPMAFNWLLGLWTGTFTLGTTTPSGFYVITVSGNDGAGNAGSFATVIRVAPFNLLGHVALPSSAISISGGSEPSINAKITYPNGNVMKTGSVEAFVSLEMNGVFVPISHARMTYQASSQSFVGPNIFAAASVLKTTPGKYIVSVQAFDNIGNYGNFTGSFFVNANSHNPISISSDSQFTAANGVISGSGTTFNPYLIAGWNTSSITISSAVSASYDLLNNWVQGSSGNGIVLDTPNSVDSLVEKDYALSNNGNGLVVANSSGVSISSVDASNNVRSGIVISNLTQGTGGLLSSVAANNGADGIILQNTPYFSISSTAATSNANHGFYVFNSRNATLTNDNATSNTVGVYVTGSPSENYGGVRIVGGNFIGNKIGVQINGLGQKIAGNLMNVSTVLIGATTQLQNNIGTLAANDSVVSLESNAIGLNNYGVIVQNSLPLAVNNVISQNSATGMNITGSYSGTGHCQIIFTNSTSFSYNACIAINYVTLNGASGLVMSNLNGSFAFQNAAVGNNGDGFDFRDMAGSLVSSLISFSNQNNGVTVLNSTNSRITANQLEGNLNGLLVKSSLNNTIDLNNATLNALDGILLSNSGSNTVDSNVAIQDAGLCTNSLSCSVAGGIELSASSGNLVYSNTLTNNTSPAKNSAGIYIDSGSSGNIVFQNNATLNYAGIAISSSSSNNIAKNSLYSNTYGIYLSNAPDNVILNNIFGRDLQNQYPNQPTVAISNIANGTSFSGPVLISWTTSGQAISLEKLIIDGKSQTVSGTSFNLNSAILSDGMHTLTIEVTNSGGLTATSTVVISTINHEGLLVKALGPAGTPLAGLTVTLKGGTVSLRATTDSSGGALFKNLSSGTYIASTVVNGTSLSLPVNFNGNASVTLYIPILSTTAHAIAASGSSFPIGLSGNITAAQLSNMFLSNTNGLYSLSFGVSGINDTTGRVTLTIPKSVVPGGLIPEVFINGNPATEESYSQNNGNYYVTFTANLGSQTNISIKFLHLVTLNLDLVVLLVVVVALLAAALVLAFRNPKLGSYPAPGQY